MEVSPEPVGPFLIQFWALCGVSSGTRTGNTRGQRCPPGPRVAVGAQETGVRGDGGPAGCGRWGLGPLGGAVAKPRNARSALPASRSPGSDPGIYAEPQRWPQLRGPSPGRLSGTHPIKGELPLSAGTGRSSGGCALRPGLPARGCPCPRPLCLRTHGRGHTTVLSSRLQQPPPASRPGFRGLWNAQPGMAAPRLLPGRCWVGLIPLQSSGPSPLRSAQFE